MALKTKFNLQQIQSFITDKIERTEKAVIETYQFAGEGFVRDARLNGAYNDITGNLRSSVGYILIKDGVQLIENFEETGNGTDKATGVTSGLTFAEELAIEYPKGIALICVAGMEYAAAVEAKGKDVITGSAQQLEVRLKKLLKQI